MGDVGHVYIQIRSGSCMIDWGSLQCVLCDMEEICVKHTDNCKTVIFDKDILSSSYDSSHLYGQVIDKLADMYL